MRSMPGPARAVVGHLPVAVIVPRHQSAIVNMADCDNQDERHLSWTARGTFPLLMVVVMASADGFLSLPPWPTAIRSAMAELHFDLFIHLKVK